MKTENSNGGKTEVLLAAPHFHNIRHVKSLAASPPLGLITTGTVLRNEGIAARVLNLATAGGEEPALFEFAGMLNTLRPSGIVGISMNITALRKGAHDLIRATKKLRPDAKIICGGINAENVYRSLMENFDIDYIMLGESEQAIAGFARAVLDGDAPRIPGIVTRENMHGEHAAQLAHPLAALPLPDYEITNLDKQKALHALPLERYNLREMKLEDGLPIEASRGCPFNCGFCAIGGRRPRSYPAGHVCANMQNLHSRHGFTAFTFIDDIFTFSKERTLALCDGIAGLNIPITWAAQTRADNTDAEIMRAMKAAGCRIVSFGVESGSERIQAGIGKTLDFEKLMHAVQNARHAGLMVQTFFLLGHPGETGGDVADTIRLVQSIKPEHFCLDTVKVFPGSKLYGEMKSAGLLSDEYWLRDETAMPSYAGLRGRDVDESTVLEVFHAWHEAADLPPPQKLLDLLSGVFARGKEIFEGCILKRFYRGNEADCHISVERCGETFLLSMPYRINDDGSIDVSVEKQPFVEYRDTYQLNMITGRLNAVLARLTHRNRSGARA